MQNPVKKMCDFPESTTTIIKIIFIHTKPITGVLCCRQTHDVQIELVELIKRVVGLHAQQSFQISTHPIGSQLTADLEPLLGIFLALGRRSKI